MISDWVQHINENHRMTTGDSDQRCNLQQHLLAPVTDPFVDSRQYPSSHCYVK